MKTQLKEKESLIFCLWCGQQTSIIWVHGHGQCANCRTNIDECCRGETCENFENTTKLIEEESNEK